MTTLQQVTKEYLKQNHSVLVFRVDYPARTSKILLQQVLQACVQRGLLPFIPTVIRQNKPYFKEIEDVYFNISHTRNMWICVISFFEIGIDIEKQRPCNTQLIAQRFFHCEELAWLQTHPDDFFNLWTRKESAVKLTKEGFSAQFKQVNTCPLSWSAFHFYPLNLPEDYIGCLCSFIPIQSVLSQVYQKELPLDSNQEN